MMLNVDIVQTGSINGGNTFPGVARPLGVVKLGPDLYTGTDAYSGYQPTGNFTGFTMLHQSGTGGAPKYGVVSQMPVVGAVENPLSDAINDTRASPDTTEVGYYKASLGSGTVLEMSASEKAGLYQYTFPENAGEKHVLVDVSHVLSSYRGQGIEQHFLGGNITVKSRGNSSDDHYYTGFGTYDNGWNRAGPWSVYFCGYFDAPSSYKTFIGADFTSDVLVEFSDEPSYESDSARLGALFTFNQTSVVSRVGVSFISADQACSNVNREIPDGTPLEAVRDSTKQAWDSQVFSKVTTSETNITKLNQLYTALYFMHLLPTNKTGENPLWESEEPYYDDIFTFWDIVSNVGRG
jgi:putative alpha-1,2-mannosidase